MNLFTHLTFILSQEDSNLSGVKTYCFIPIVSSHLFNFPFQDDHNWNSGDHHCVFNVQTIRLLFYIIKKVVFSNNKVPLHLQDKR